MRYQEMTDAELSALMVEKDHKAFSEIYNRYQALLCCYAFRMTKSAQMGLDIVQEVFYAIWKNVEQVDPSRPIDRYLFSCVTNRVINAIRNDRVRGNHLERLARHMNDYPAPDEKLIEKQLQEQVEREIRLLPERMRYTFELSRKNQLSYKEISKKTGTSEGTVKKQMYYALNILRTKLTIVSLLLYLLLY